MRTLLACFFLLFGTMALCQSGRGYVPTKGYVPDEATALRVAKAVLVPVYGDKQIDSERPFTAKLKGDVWTVEGALRCPDGEGGFTTDCDGGVAVVKISKRDARVLYMMHGK